MRISNESIFGADINHPKRAMQIRAVHAVIGGYEEAITEDQIQLYGVYIYEGNRFEGPAWHAADFPTRNEAMAYAHGFADGIEQ